MKSDETGPFIGDLEVLIGLVSCEVETSNGRDQNKGTCDAVPVLERRWLSHGRVFLTFLFFPLLVALSCPGDGAGVEYSMGRIFLK